MAWRAFLCSPACAHWLPRAAGGGGAGTQLGLVTHRARQACGVVVTRKGTHLWGRSGRFFGRRQRRLEVAMHGGRGGFVRSPPGQRRDQAAEVMRFAFLVLPAGREAPRRHPPQLHPQRCPSSRENWWSSALSLSQLSRASCLLAHTIFALQNSDKERPARCRDAGGWRPTLEPPGVEGPANQSRPLPPWPSKPS